MRGSWRRDAGPDSAVVEFFVVRTGSVCAHYFSIDRRMPLIDSNQKPAPSRILPFQKEVEQNVRGFIEKLEVHWPIEKTSVIGLQRDILCSP